MIYSLKKKNRKKFSLFYISSEKFGYGHCNRIINLISILDSKKKNKFYHFLFGDKYRNKNRFLNKLSSEVTSNTNIILDITNKSFLNKNTILRLKKIFSKKTLAKIFIIDTPTKKNLSTILNLKYSKTLVPFQINNNLSKKYLTIKKKKIGIDYFIYSHKNLKKRQKIYDVVLSFGGSDKYKGTIYVLKILEQLKIKKKIAVVVGKYFNQHYKKKILCICKKNKYLTLSFSENFSDVLNQSRFLITNSGLTKYEGHFHNLKVLVFSDTKASQGIDYLFIKKTKQFHFNYFKNYEKDKIKLDKYLNMKLNFKIVDKNILKTNNKKLINFFADE